jgi:signal transduction histidine kinase
VRFLPSTRDRLLFLVGCQTTITVLLIVVFVRSESKTTDDYHRTNWILGIAMTATAAACFLCFRMIYDTASRIRNLAAYVRRFQDSGKLERIGDPRSDYISVLANAIDAGFTAIASRERERAQFIAIAAHELKTPVTTIQGYASFLATHPLTPEAPRALQVIHRQAWRLSRLIEALFLAVRARSGSLRFEPRPLNMSMLVRRVLREMEPFLSKKAFVSRIAENISILGDEALLEHALWCLFTCAVALAPDEQPIQVSLVRQEKASLTVDIEPSGVPVGEVQNLFLPFHSLQYETVDGLRSPIGLYLCREIVRVHNGQLYVHDTSSLSPEFLMELPI